MIQAGKSGWRLKPTIRILNQASKVAISGEVASTNGSDMNGTMVSVQKLTSDPIRETNKIKVQGSTVAEGEDATNNATYTLFTNPGEQNLVAYKDGFLPGVYSLSPSAGDALTRNFTLQNATMGAINGTVSVDDDLSDDNYVVLSFRHQVEDIDSNNATWVELKSLTQAGDISDDALSNDDNFSWTFNATLPDMSSSPGQYRVVATLYNKDYDDDDDDDDPKILAEQGLNATLGDELSFTLNEWVE